MAEGPVGWRAGMDSRCLGLGLADSRGTEREAEREGILQKPLASD